jgi:hypothetical protein
LARERPAADRSRRAALVAFVAFLGVSFFVLLWIGRNVWYYQDDWSILLRDIGTPSGLLRPFNQSHWLTLPLIAYHGLFWAFGLNYLPYQITIIVLNLVLATLLRLLMRRAGVGPWIATIAAGSFVLGPAYEAKLFAIQMSLVGSAVFGVCHLLCADHDGRFDRRDIVGLVFGTLALMTSGVGAVMIAVVGAAVLIRRGWRLALLHTVPLAAINLAWYASQRTEISSTPGSSATSAPHWIVSGERAAFQAFGGSRLAALAFLVLLVFGLVLAWRPLPARDFRRQAAAPVALLLGGPILFALTSASRSALPDYEKSSKFVNLAVAFALPAIAVAADAVARRWRRLAPAVGLALLIPILANLGTFSAESSFPSAFFRHEKAVMLGAAYSPLASDVPRDLQPNTGLYHAPGVTMGFLDDARRAGRLPPRPKLTQHTSEELRVRLGIEQTRDATPDGYECYRQHNRPLTLRPPDGARYVLASAVAVNWGATVRQSHDGQVLFLPQSGTVLKINAPDLEITIANAHAPSLPFSFCALDTSADDGLIWVGTDDSPPELQQQAISLARARSRAPIGATRVLVAGDSLATSFASVARPEYSGLGIHGVVEWASGCDVLGGRVAIGRNVLPEEPCSYADSYRSALSSYRPDVSVLVIGPTAVFDRQVNETRVDVGTPAYRDWLYARLDALRIALAANHTTFMLTTVPCMKPPATGTYAGFAAIQRDPRRMHDVNQVLEMYAENRGLRLADLGDYLCRHRDYLEADGVRLNETGRRAAWAWLSELAARTGPPR